MPLYDRKDGLTGAVIYAIGDTIAAALLGSFSWTRLLGMMLLGGTLYAIEIPSYFHWIDRKVPRASVRWAAWIRMTLGLVFFNPLWIARHVLFIRLFEGRLDEVRWTLLSDGAHSFAMNLPLAIAGNYVIQNHVPAHRRYMANAVFSGIMAVTYALAALWKA